ncbi:MAG TPA: M15 family metallopeptidase [Candidatus Paceibacterota bacterium]|nr:M15 family metallopeptidase [Candidatus Paceibacterota bacterium]
MYSLDEALAGSSAPKEILETLSLVDIPYIGFDGEEHLGQLVVHTDLVSDVKEIFAELCNSAFPIERIVPVVAYGWDDDASMADNNTSAFNYRVIVGQDRLSNHSLGRAIDINPKQNPYYAVNGNVYPSGSHYQPTEPGTLFAGSNAVQAFTKRGWRWLGDRAENTDYQHFEMI